VLGRDDIKRRAREGLTDILLSRQDLPVTLEVTLDRQFTELEAEVEAEGSYVPRRWQFFRGRPRDEQLRIEPSLTLAIERSRERFMLLEGEPGSGKTVSLRKVERAFAQRIRRDPSCSLPLPLYVNLRYVASDGNRPAAKLRECILGALHEDPAIASARFTDGCRHGGWLLLFDSFDEIPDVLGAIEADLSVQTYARAIQDLCVEINRDPTQSCRALVASRSYRGPRGVCWSRFRIRPLSEERRRQFISNLGLDEEQTTILADDLITAPSEIQRWAYNPLTLTMLCEVIKDGGEFPPNVYTLFEKYLSLRFIRDAGRVREFYRGGIDSLRRAAEEIAFVISSDPALGLAPSNREIREALVRHERQVEDVDRALFAIGHLELALSEDRVDGTHIAFRHRRLQEYFATCVIVREPGLLTPEQLLFDARWREACVVLLQSSSIDRLKELLRRAEQFVLTCHDEMGHSIQDVDVLLTPEAAMAWMVERLKPAVTPERVVWPAKLYHVMDLLQSGFSYRHDLPQSLQAASASLLIQIYQSGIRLDKMYVLELAGILPKGYMEGLANAALDGDSGLLHDGAFRLLPWAGELSVVTDLKVVRLLYRMACSGQISRERLATDARIRRMRNPILEILFAMGVAFVDADRALRLTLLAVYPTCAVLILGSGTISVRPSLELLGVAVLLSVLAMAARHLGAKRPIALTIILDLLTLIVVIALEAQLRAFLETSVSFLLVLAWGYAFLWSYFALAGVRYIVPVSRGVWPFLPLVVSIGLIRQYPSVVLFFMWMAGVAGFLLSLDNAAPTPDWVAILIAVPLLGLFGFVLFAGLCHFALFCRDRFVAWRSRPQEPVKLTVAGLKEHLAQLRTSSGRFRLLRDVVRGRHFELLVDDASHAELGSLQCALEAHSLRANECQNGGVREVIFTRLSFSPTYIRSCTTDHQRWCLVNYATVAAADSLAITIDLITQLLDQSEKSLGHHSSRAAE
jgi:hypothetical protein